MTKTEMIRAVKALQTQTIIQERACKAMWDYSGTHNAGLTQQLNDCVDTARTHIEALQHVIDELAKPDVDEV